MAKTKIHQMIKDQLYEIVAEYDIESFLPLISTFASGLKRPSEYNKAVRQLSCLDDPRATEMLEKILPWRLILNISITEKNTDGMCTFDYAKSNNPNSYELLKNHEVILPKGANIEEESDEQEYQTKPNFFSPTSVIEKSIEESTDSTCLIS